MFGTGHLDELASLRHSLPHMTPESQFWVSRARSVAGQSVPLYCGVGLVQVLVLSWVPWSQVAVQVPQSVQVVQAP